MSWTTLSSTLFGGSLAFGGSMIGQWLNERRAIKREERTREHEREAWARQIRHESHVAFLKAFDDLLNTAIEVNTNRYEPMPDPESDWLNPTYTKLQELRLVSQEDAIYKADIAFEELQRYLFSDGKFEDVRLAFDQYIAAVRREFRVPSIGLTDD